MADSHSVRPGSSGILSDAHRIVRIGEPRPAGAAVYVWRDVVEQLIDSALFEPERYRACVLFGGFAQGPAGGQLEVRGFVDLSPYASPRDVVADWMVEWERTRVRIGRANGGAVPVGWASLRPGSRGLLNGDEQLVHRTFCALPWQVLLVVDPVAGELGLWGPQADGILVNIGFNLVARPEPRTPQTQERP